MKRLVFRPKRGGLVCLDERQLAFHLYKTDWPNASSDFDKLRKPFQEMWLNRARRLIESLSDV